MCSDIVAYLELYLPFDCLLVNWFPRSPFAAMVLPVLVELHHSLPGTAFASSLYPMQNRMFFLVCSVTLEQQHG